MQINNAGYTAQKFYDDSRKSSGDEMASIEHATAVSANDFEHLSLVMSSKMARHANDFDLPWYRHNFF